MTASSVPPTRSHSSFALDSPSAAAIAAVVLVGLIAIGFLVGPMLVAGPTPSDDSSPTASLIASEEPSATSAPTSTPIPTPTATATATAEPTPTPVARWIGLDWSEPVTPSFTVHLRDLVPWGDGYVAVGAVPVGSGRSQAAFLTSPDGLHWTVTHQVDPTGDRFPSHLVAMDQALYAFSPRASDDADAVPSGEYPGPLIWTSRDGIGWDLVDSPSWEAAWADARQGVGALPEGWSQTQHGITTGLVDVAGAPGGFVAIGNAFGDDAVVPIVLASTDGQQWAPADLPSDAGAMLNAAVAHDGRFMVTGATGVGPDPATATAAAWYSEDGREWHAATVDPGEVGAAGTELGPLWAARDGVLACRGNREMGAGGWRYMDAWLSTDGASWRSDPQPGPHPACDWSASDGTRLVALGPRDHASPVEWPGVTVASTSTDGVDWQPLDLDSTLTDRLERFWVVPDGVIYAGEQSFWFGMPTTAGD